MKLIVAFSYFSKAPKVKGGRRHVPINRLFKCTIATAKIASVEGEA